LLGEQETENGLNLRWIFRVGFRNKIHLIFLGYVAGCLNPTAGTLVGYTWKVQNWHKLTGVLRHFSPPGILCILGTSLGRCLCCPGRSR